MAEKATRLRRDEDRPQFQITRHVAAYKRWWL